MPSNRVALSGNSRQRVSRLPARPVVPVVEYGKVAEDVPDRRRPPTALLRPLGRVRAEAKEDKGGAR